jgi:hypothetical protein
MINKSTIVSDDGIKLGFDESDTDWSNYQLQKKEFDKYW